MYFRVDMSHSLSVGPSVCEEFVCVSLGFSMSVYVCRLSVCVCVCVVAVDRCPRSTACHTGSVNLQQT